MHGLVVVALRLRFGELRGNPRALCAGRLRGRENHIEAAIPGPVKAPHRALVAAPKGWPEYIRIDATTRGKLLLACTAQRSRSQLQRTQRAGGTRSPGITSDARLQTSRRVFGYPRRQSQAWRAVIAKDEPARRFFWFALHLFAACVDAESHLTYRNAITRSKNRCSSSGAPGKRLDALGPRIPACCSLPLTREIGVHSRCPVLAAEEHHRLPDKTTWVQTARTPPTGSRLGPSRTVAGPIAGKEPDGQLLPDVVPSGKPELSGGMSTVIS
jgi:hypothetical protein